MSQQTDYVWLGTSTPAYPIGGRDPLLDHRDESWQWDKLTLAEAPAGTLDGVEAGTLEFNVNATIRGGGSLTWSGSPEQEPDWSKILLQPWYVLRTADMEIRWPRGVFIPAAPVDSHNDTGKTVEVELYDKLLILDQDKVDTTYTVGKGANVVAAVRAVISSAGQTRHAIEDSTSTLRSAMVWEAGTSKLRIVNDLLDSINYFSLWCDGYGVYQGNPYKAPSARPVVRTFVDDEDSIYSPDFTHDRDMFNIPNKVIQVGRGDGDTPGLVATATNTDPGNPYSQPSRGRWIVHVDTDVEAASQAVLDGIAARRLGELAQVASAVDFTHAHVPLELNDVVVFERGSQGLALTATVQTMSISTTPGDLMQSKIREVTT